MTAESATSAAEVLHETLAQDVAAVERAQQLSGAAGQAPAVLPGYRMLRPLGEGKYGTVWLAREQNTGKHVAIKFYSHRRGVDWSLLGREVEKLAVLYTSRNIVGLLSVGWDHDPPYYVMEYLPNGSLAGRLEAGPLPAADAVRLATRVCQALVHAHGSGILHCDLKPANILLDQDLEPRLCDFGQSRQADEQSHALGTLFYMAPEQADLKAVPDARWDVYALGALLYHMLVGEPPHRTAESDQILRDARSLETRLMLYRELVMGSPRPAAHRAVAGVDAALAEIIDRCLAVTPAKRFPNAQAVLDRLVARERARSRRPIIWLGLLLPIILLGGIAPVALDAMRDAVGTARESLTTRALESDAMSVGLLSEALRRELADRLGELSTIAADDEVRKAVQEFSDVSMADRDPLLKVLERRRTAYSTKLSLQGRSPDASWFLCDDEGFQRWRYPFSKTVDENYRFRDYFHGQDREFDESMMQEVQPLQEPHLSLPYVSSTTGQLTLALSVPVRDTENRKVIGVLARTLLLGELLASFERGLETQGQQAVRRRLALIDSRNWALLAHPWITDHDEDRPLPPDTYANLTIEESTRSQLAELLRLLESDRPEAAYEDKLDRVDGYRDPVAKFAPTEYGGAWLAAFSQVGDTTWIAVVQEDRTAAWQPVEDLRARLIWSAMIAVGLVGLLMAGSWWLILTMLGDRWPRWLKGWTGRSPYTGASISPSLSLTTREVTSD